MLIFVALLSLSAFQVDIRSDKVVFFWLAGSAITLIYIILGQLNEAPFAAALQVSAIYIIFPILWIAVSKKLLLTYTIDQIVFYFKWLGLICSATIVVFYYLFLNFGADAVLFFIEEPNIDLASEGYIGATMYVFGTLIFLLGGYISAFDVSKAKLLDYAMLLIFLVIAMIAGRSAMLLAVLVGLFLNATNIILNIKKLPPFSILSRFTVISGITFISLTSVIYAGLDPASLISPLIDKITTIGGEGRMQQFDAMLRSIHDSWGLGAGHGVSVYYTVSDDHPWRYEMIWLASLHRVGVVGAAIYAAPFLITLFQGLSTLLRSQITNSELFLLGGFVSAFLASNTNPYVEALVFQWMYILPIVYFMHFRRKGKRENMISSATI
jgi:hypothetical protein